MIFALLLFFLPGRDVQYWADPCADPAKGCESADAELADWAMQAWQNASAGLLRARRVQNPDEARIRVRWVGAREGVYGEVRGAEVYVRPAPREQDALLRETIVYLTCLHEIGHALGLAHTARFEDIMYSFQYGGDIPEYFGRYRRKLKSRNDIRANSGISEADKTRLLAALKESRP